jgi:teichoic acid transport system ATP-binding protein
MAAANPGWPDRAVGAKEGGQRPTVVVDHLSVTYRLLVDTKAAKPASGWRRIVGRGVKHRTMRSVHALHDICFVAYHGDVIGLVGSNGSGKSTLLRAIAGLTPATSGVVLAESSPTLLGVNAALVNELSGESNIRLGGLAMGMSRPQVDARLDEIAELAGIGDFLDLPMRAYSSGMAARLRFAIAAAADPEILLIDEALATGDAEFREKSSRKIRELQGSASSVFIVSHNLADIENVCNRAMWIDKGHLKADGAVSDVLNEYRASIRKLK